MPVTARYHWTIRDLLKGRRVVMLQDSHLSNSRLAVLTAAVALPVILGWVRGKPLFPEWLQFLFEASASISALTFVGILFAECLLRFRFPRHPDAGGEVAWAISEEEVIITTPNFRTEMQWSTIQRVIVDPNCIILMPHRQILYFLPARAFATSADMEAVSEMASRLVPDFRRLK